MILRHLNLLIIRYLRKIQCDRTLYIFRFMKILIFYCKMNHFHSKANWENNSLYWYFSHFFIIRYCLFDLLLIGLRKKPMSLSVLISLLYVHFQVLLRKIWSRSWLRNIKPSLPSWTIWKLNLDLPSCKTDPNMNTKT